MRRLSFGVSLVPRLYHTRIGTLLADLVQGAAHHDDILVAGETAEEHRKVLNVVFKRASKAQLRAQGAKCQYFKENLEYFGHRIDGRSNYPSKSKVEAIHQALTPENAKELQAFLGIVNFYNRFLKGRFGVTKCCTIYWTVTVRGNEVESSSKLLASQSRLVHFNLKAPYILSCDASPVGVGAVLAHQDAEGLEQPVAYVSRTLDKTA